MKTFPEIKEDLQSLGVQPDSTGRDFWSQFRTRAAGIRRDSPVTRRLESAVFFRVGALAAAAVIVCLAALRGYDRTAPTAGVDGAVRSLTIDMPHGAVFIMQDAEHSGTILWVVDL